MYIADNKKLESMCIVSPTLKELMKKQQALEMQKKRKVLQTLGVLPQKIDFKYGKFIPVS